MLVSNVTSMLTSFASQITSFANGVSSQQISTWAKTQLPRILAAGGQLIAQLASALLRSLPKVISAIGQIGSAIVRGLGSALWGKVTAAANGIKNRFMQPINAMKDKVKSAIDKIKGYFPFHIGKVMSGIKLPHFSISGKFSINPPSTPKVSVSWYKRGGIIDGATVFGGIGMGEAGPEAILPLDPFWKKLDQIATGTNSTNVVININGANKDPKAIAAEVKRELIKETNQRRLAWQ